MARSRTLMVMGAGIYQVPLIRKAQEMGLRTVVVSILGNYPGFELADEVAELDTRDEEGVLALARQRGISGIVTTGTDVAMRSIGRVCDELGLCGIGYDAACKLTDKALMKQAFAAGGVSTSEFRVVASEAEALAAVRELGYPVMMKAVDVSGSRGVAQVKDDDELRTAFARSVAASSAGHYLVERVAPGVEIGLDGFVWGGELRLCLPHTKYTYSAGGVTVPVGHGFPYACSPELEERLRHETEAVVSATGADNCAINADIFVDVDGGVSVIEAGGRCGATAIPELISLHTGIDFYREMIRAALGEEPDLRVKASVPCIGMLAYSPCGGVVERIDLPQDPTICVTLDYAVGDTVPAMHSGPDRLGQLVAANISPDKMAALATSLITVRS